MNHQSPNRLSTVVSLLRTEQLTLTLQKNPCQNRGYNCGYRDPMPDIFSVNHSRLRHCFGARRGHQLLAKWLLQRREITGEGPASSPILRQIGIIAEAGPLLRSQAA
jgi:hypothetical protein